MLTRRLLSVAAALPLALGLLTITAGPGAAVGTVTLSATNQAVGAVRLLAEVRGGYDGVVVFELEGHDPVTVPLGTMAVAGEPNFDQDKYSSIAPDYYQAILDIPGLDPTGTYLATATFVPAGGEPVGGEVASAEVTTTLTVERTPFLFRVGPAEHGVYFDLGVVAYPTGTKLGTIRIVNMKTGIADTYGIIARARPCDGFVISSARLKRGVYQFRAIFTPNPGLPEYVARAVVTSPKIRVAG